MKRYVIFAGDRSYAAGGALDYIADYARAKDAHAFRMAYLGTTRGKWCHIWDTKTHTILPPVEEDEHGFAGGITGD